jgi:mannosylglycerate hydrolase
MSVEPTTLYLYLHTHWDREWYWSFAGYRTQLVTVVKNVVALLESGGLNSFVLDGQTALIEDVLEVSPELLPRLKKLIEAGKLFIGPWYVLADQMLVGGESLIRNLHYGLKLCATLGGASKVGYCPDTFGHSADLPRILRGFEIESAVVWRGVPELKGSPLFDWQSPDGSEVLTLALTQGYYQSVFGEGLKSLDLAGQLLKYLDFVQDAKGVVKVNQNSTVAPTVVPEMNGALLPVGADHVGPQANFKEQLREAMALINKEDLYVRPQTVSLDQFFDALADSTRAKFGEARRLIAGELRDNKAAFSCARAYMLDGVLSTRLYLKRDNRLSEYQILRQAEPFRALLAVHGLLPYCNDELDFYWKLLLKNHPHDSICGCSIDSVHREMLTRTESIGDGLKMLVAQGKEALLQNAQKIKGEAVSDVRFGARDLDVVDPALEFAKVSVFNPTASLQSAPVRLKLAIEKKSQTALPHGFQPTSRSTITETFIGLSQVPVFKDVEVVEGYIHVGAVQPTSLQTFDTASSAVQTETSSVDVSLKENPDTLGQLELDNGVFAIYFDPDGGLIARTAGGVEHKIGHRLIDLGDAGDTYNFDPVALDEPLAARLVSVRKGQSGPHVASIVAHYQIDLPEGLVARGTLKKEGEAENAPELTVFERAKIRIPHKIETEIILKKDTPVVFFETVFQHSARDHRLEVVFDLPEPVEYSFSENHFALIKRYHDKKAPLNQSVEADELIALGHEAPLVKHPCQRFFVAGEQIFFNKGLPEYSVGAGQVSVTLLRAVSYLSRTRLRTRGGGAGPIMPTPEANSPGLVHVSYGWSLAGLAGEPSSGNPEVAAFALADTYEYDPVAFASPAQYVSKNAQEDSSTNCLRLLEMDNQAIRFSAGYIDDQNRLVIRLLNCTSKAQSTSLKFGPAIKSVARGQFDGNELKPLKEDGAPRDYKNYRLDFEHCQTITLFCQY